MRKHCEQQGRKLKIKSGDMVKVIAGSDKGKIGKVIKANPKESKVQVEGVQVNIKHQKPSQTNTGGIAKKTAYIHVSNIKKINVPE
jgi:large subunit ribosomal protein L24